MEDDVIRIASANGWRVRYESSEGRTWSEPLVGWAVLRSGEVRALATDTAGQVEQVHFMSGASIYHPDSHEDVPK